MGLAALLAEPFYLGGGASVDVPFKWDCSLNGRPYMFDWKYAGSENFSRGSIHLLKPQQDTSASVSEASLNPEEFARRAVETWHHGAGQSFYDRPTSDPARFRSSKGVDPWTRWELSLLPDTELARASVNTNLALMVVGDYLYVADGNEVYWTTDLSAYTAAAIQNGEAAQSVKSIASDGYQLYAALGSNGIHRSVRGASTTSHYSDLSATLIGYVKGRLMAANGNAVYNVIASGAAPSALLTHPNTDFTWVGFAEGTGHIYAAGYSGDKSLVYRTAVKADGTALDVPVVAGELPDGEIVRSIAGYLGFLLVGTDKGWRLVSLDAAGNFAGSSDIIPTPAAVRCFEAQDRFVWFGWTDYDATSTGLGRADLSQFTTGITPAYASDLMATAQSDVLSVVTYDDARVFAVSGIGVYAASADKVATGTVDSGLITYGLPDRKVAAYVDVRHEPLAGSIDVGLAVDSSVTFTALGASATAGSTSVVLAIGAQRGETFELRLTLERDGTATTTGPTLIRTTLEANPAPGRGQFFTVPLMLYETLAVAGGDETIHPAVELSALVDMEASGEAVSYQDALGSTTVFLDDHTFIVDKHTEHRDAFNGTFIAKMRRTRQRST